jgi:hypothetical protein
MDATMTAICSMFLADPIIEQNRNNARVGGILPQQIPPPRRRVARRSRLLDRKHTGTERARPRTFYASATGINAAVIPGRIAPH